MWIGHHKDILKLAFRVFRIAVSLESPHGGQFSVNYDDKAKLSFKYPTPHPIRLRTQHHKQFLYKLTPPPLDIRSIPCTNLNQNELSLDLLHTFTIERILICRDSRSHAKAKMGESLEGRTKLTSDEKFKALNKALRVDKKKPPGRQKMACTAIFRIRILLMYAEHFWNFLHANRKLDSMRTNNWLTCFM